MNYHNITKDDMLNGDGLRVVLWVAGCTHHCANCQNPITWYVPGNNEGTTATIKALYSFCSILLSFIISVHLLVDKPEFVNGILSCY